MTHITHKSRLIKSPFLLAAFVGLLDLSGGFISIISDIYWLTFDTIIKDPTLFATYTLQYGLILSGLVLGAILLFIGFIGTIYLVYRFIKSGGLDAEIKIEYSHIKECALQHKRDKIFRK